MWSRLGITNAMTKQNLTVLTCVRAMADSDIFVGYYADGGRYGWHGEGLQPSLDVCLTEFPWIENYRDRSVTEIEWLAGGLLEFDQEHNKWPGASLFMYRDAKYDTAQREAAQKKLSMLLAKGDSWETIKRNQEAKALCTELGKWMEEYDSPHYYVDGAAWPLLPAKLSAAELEDTNQKLQKWLVGLKATKQNLQTAVRERCASFGTCVLDYPDPGFGAYMQWDFINRVLVGCLPAPVPRSVWEDVVVAQEAFAHSRIRFVRSHKELHKVEETLQWGGGKPVLVVGEPGGGKSTLAAILALGKASATGSSVVKGVDDTGWEDAKRVFWFVGCNAGSTVLKEMLRYVTARLWAVARESGLLRLETETVAGTGAESEAANEQLDRVGVGENGGSEHEDDGGVKRPVDAFQDAIKMWKSTDCWKGGSPPKVLLIFDALNQLRNDPEDFSGGVKEESRAENQRDDAEEQLEPDEEEEQPDGEEEQPDEAAAVAQREGKAPAAKEPSMPHNLFWLPEDFPPEIRVVVTSLSKCNEYPSGETARVLQARGCPQVNVQGLDPLEVSDLITNFFARNFKKPEEALVKRITEAEQVKNPMFLTVLLEEVVCHGTWGGIDEWLAELLEAQDVPGLLTIMLRRLEGLFNSEETPDFVGRCLQLVWASREGMQEVELLQVLNTEDQRRAASGKLRARLEFANHWLPLRFGMQRLLQRRGGLYNFAHDFVRQAVERLFITRVKAADGTSEAGLLVDEVLNGADTGLKEGVDARVRSIHERLAKHFQVLAAQDAGGTFLDEPPRELREMGYHQRRAGSSPSVTVAVRVRPFLPMEGKTNAEQQCIVKMHGKRTMLTPPDGAKPVVKTYDYSLWSVGGQHGEGKTVGQKDVYRLLGADVIDQVLDGYDVTLLAYGQTGSGKTYSMYGTPSESGLIPRTCKMLLSRLMELSRQQELFPTVTLSVCEIYCEQVRDMLAEVKSDGDPDETKPLNVRDRKVLMVDGSEDVQTYVQGLAVHAITNHEQLQQALLSSVNARKTRKTGMNDTSSRSHCLSILTVHLLRMASHSAATSGSSESKPAPSWSIIPKVVEEEYSLTHAGGRKVDFHSIISKEYNVFALELPGYQLRAAFEAWRNNPLRSFVAACHFISTLRITRKILGGPASGAWLELDLSSQEPAERAALLGGLEVGRDIQICFDIAQPNAGPRLVVPLRLGKFVSRIGFPGGEWSEEVVKESAGCMEVAREGDTVVGLRPRNLFQVRGSRTSRVNLVDLAGNERVSKSHVKGQALVEVQAINKSLSALCKTIRVLGKAGKTQQDSSSVFVAYRESNLTRLLRNSLGGTAKIILLATISPSANHAHESRDTLNYASLAKQIVTRATRRAEEGMLAQAQHLQITVQGEPLTVGTVTVFPGGEHPAKALKLAEMLFKSADPTVPGAAWSFQLAGGESAWLQLDLGPEKSVCLKAYAMWKEGTEKQSPRAWRVMGSTAEEVPGGPWSEGGKGDWELIDAQEGVEWGEKKKKRFAVSDRYVGSGRSYRRLRWVFLERQTGINGGPAARVISVSSMRLFSGPVNNALPTEEVLRLKLVEYLDEMTECIPGKKDGFTPILKAVKDGETKHAKLLIEAGTHLEITNKYGMTPLYYAARYNRPEIIRLFARQGANVNCSDIKGVSALHRAARNGHTDAVHALIECGASVSEKTQDGATALFLAEKLGKEACAALLRAAGAVSTGGQGS